MRVHTVSEMLDAPPSAGRRGSSHPPSRFLGGLRHRLGVRAAPEASPRVMSGGAPARLDAVHPPVHGGRSPSSTYVRGACTPSPCSELLQTTWRVKNPGHQRRPPSRVGMAKVGGLSRPWRPPSSRAAPPPPPYNPFHGSASERRLRPARGGGILGGMAAQASIQPVSSPRAARRSRARAAILSSRDHRPPSGS